MKNCKKTTYRTAIMGASVFMMTVMFLGTGTNPKVAEAVSVASQQTKPSVDLKKMKDLYEQVKTGKRLEAAQEFVAQALKMKPADVNNVLKSLPLKLKERKWGRSTMREYTSTDGKGLIFANTLGNQFNFQFKLEEKLTEPDLKVEFPPEYYVLFEKGQPQSFKTEEEVNKFKEENPERKIKEVLHITSWEQGKEQLPEVFNENRGRSFPVSEEQKNLFKGHLDALNKYGFKDVSEEDIKISCNNLGQCQKGISIYDKKQFYPTHTLSIGISGEHLTFHTVPKVDPNPVL